MDGLVELIPCVLVLNEGIKLDMIFIKLTRMVKTSTIPLILQFLSLEQDMPWDNSVRRR